MRFSQFLLLLVVIFVACYSTVTTAENSVQIENRVTDSNREAVDEGRRYLKGNKKTTDLDAAEEERVGATTPSLKQLFGLAKLPDFSKIPGIKQLVAFLKKHGSKISAKNNARRRRKFESNPNAYGL
ncbi:hypothetical protein PHYPSEUDO_015244 [Phytophthora pseudosyringae]|uniref:RxLR effector protein n=1 Tax=Phytophthora pseudosyringae TaxID=221518 RepID=A0A8T1V895_9STRA|nr:hypothetical protein PHYPSEUDO_015244 [Phytophthora pseudosyringae]